MKLTLHVVELSHPSRTAAAALQHKGLEFERVVLTPPHMADMEKVYGPGHTTVPGLLIDEERVHGSVAILERLEQLAPEPPLYPEPIAAAVREAERWGDAELQDLGRRLPWGALHFRPEAMGTFADGGGALDPAGVDFAMRYVHASWKYHKISAVRLAEDLAGLPAKLDHVDALAAEGIVGGEQPTAADLQIGATLRVLLIVGDVRPLLEGRPAAAIARRWFPDYPGDIPAGAFPPGWVPARAA
ncbi:MAG TPA: glutathione S-transferase [Solirubrobacteraceae bacterium]|jgi:glutathione S-transferase